MQGISLATNAYTWLKSIKYEKYSNNFTQNGYDTVDEIQYLSKADLNDMDITLGGHVKKLLAEIDKLKSLIERQQTNNYAHTSCDNQYASSICSSIASNAWSQTASSQVTNISYQTDASSTDCLSVSLGLDENGSIQCQYNDHSNTNNNNENISYDITNNNNENISQTMQDIQMNNIEINKTQSPTQIDNINISNDGNIQNVLALFSGPKITEWNEDIKMKEDINCSSYANTDVGANYLQNNTIAFIQNTLNPFEPTEKVSGQLVDAAFKTTNKTFMYDLLKNVKIGHDYSPYKNKFNVIFSKCDQLYK
eukprot:470356_1